MRLQGWTGFFRNRFFNLTVTLFLLVLLQLPQAVLLKLLEGIKEGDDEEQQQQQQQQLLLQQQYGGYMQQPLQLSAPKVGKFFLSFYFFLRVVFF